MKHFSCFLSAFVLAGCVAGNNVGVSGQERHAAGSDDVRDTPLSYNHSEPVLTINDYARNIVHELMAQHRIPDDMAMVAVTDFSYVDTALDGGSVVSNHLSEAIIYDLHKFGVNVLDFKVTDYIRVTPSGDFVLSRSFEELHHEQPIKYVVTGTLTPHAKGILVNARLVQIDNKRVISAARSFIPDDIVKTIQHREQQYLLQLKQG